MTQQTNPPIFKEIQKFRSVWWVMVLVGAVALWIWYGFIQQIILGYPFGTNPGPDWLMWLLWLGIGIGLPWLFYTMHLTTEVHPDHIALNYYPFTTRQIPLTDIKQHQARTYQAIKEYGGWGLKGWSSDNKAYNVYGNQGVELTLLNGQRVMIGSQKAEELAQAITIQMK